MIKSLTYLLLFVPVITLSQINTSSLDSIQKLDEVIIKTNSMFGSKFVAENRTGSAYYLSTYELQKLGSTDINRVLNAVPGVTFYEEDGFGLRPNISLRGTSPQRSAKISLMEDGVLISPAPYSAPSAYYFPSVARMQAVEILKGSSQIQYGPFTTGGAVNMVSTEIPESFKGIIKASYGSFDTSQLYGHVGGASKKFGYLIEFLNYNSNGFKDLIDDRNTGFDINDIIAKLSYELSSNNNLNQRLDFKFHFYDELSNETYLGLSESDFSNSPFERYAASQVDNMDAEQVQYQLTHTIDIGENIRIATNAYTNQFSRNWYKLDDVVFEDDTQKIATVVANPELYPGHMGLLRGELSGFDDNLLVKANNRKYRSKGIQTKFDYHWNGEHTFNDLEIGLRYHFDEEDRFQWEDGYDISGGIMSITSNGPGGSQGNRISSARAFASFITYKLKIDRWTFTPGLRYENILLEREDFGNDDPDRTGFELSRRSNNVNILIPGIGINYKLNNDLSLFSGVHKGFSPPGNQPNERAEESVNYELGSRFRWGKFSGEVIGFYNDYSNLLGSDLAATGGTGTLDQFNAGQVRVNGFEVLLNYDPLQTKSNWSLPISFGYTLTNTEFLTSFGSEDDLWGEVRAGDELPYIPQQQLNASISIDHSRFQINFNARFNGEFRTQAGSGSIPADELVASNFIIDLSAKYYFSSKLTARLNIINLLDETYAVSRVPAGLRPGHPFGSYFGLEYRF
ncbi:MAG: TonB-dependent receptor [Flavobacteriaceae bacterium]|nr:TonB-dependent receptor [Flavobacteriaceae bacterium]